MGVRSVSAVKVFINIKSDKEVVMSNIYSSCKDRSKCILIGVATLLITLLSAYGLSFLDDGTDRVTMVDGVFHEYNPWTKHNN